MTPPRRGKKEANSETASALEGEGWLSSFRNIERMFV